VYLQSRGNCKTLPEGKGLSSLMLYRFEIRIYTPFQNWDFIKKITLSTQHRKITGIQSVFAKLRKIASPPREYSGLIQPLDSQ
jgi:hypothetical protein